MNSVEFLLISMDTRPLAIASCDGVILCVVQDLQSTIFGLSSQALLHHSIASVILTTRCGDELSSFMKRLSEGEDDVQCDLCTKSNFEIHITKLVVFDSFFFYKLLCGDRQEGRIVHSDFLLMLLNKSIIVATSPRSPADCSSPAPGEEQDDEELSFNDVFDFAATESEASCSATSSPAQEMYVRVPHLIRPTADRTQQIKREYSDAWGDLVSVDEAYTSSWFY